MGQSSSLRADRGSADEYNSRLVVAEVLVTAWVGSDNAMNELRGVTADSCQLK